MKIDIQKTQVKALLKFIGAYPIGGGNQNILDERDWSRFAGVYFKLRESLEEDKKGGE